MARIGKPSLARMALAAHYESMDTGDLPDGWECVGAGSFRSAYLGPDGVVYKVEYEYSEDGYGNVHESRMAKRLRRMRWENVRIPATTLYALEGDSVLAMEYVSGVMGSASEPSAHREARYEMYSKGQLVDMHGDNFLFEGDTLVPVDMASPVADNSGWNFADKRVLECGGGSIGDREW